jgi:hypothetical protein
MREKLIELLQNDNWTITCDIENINCYDCERSNERDCAAVMIADHLIANGVTVREMGRWYIRIDDYDCEYMVCSACGTDFFDGENDTVDYKPNFCRVCGADMRGEEHETD